MFARSKVRVSVAVCLSVVSVGACGGSSDKSSTALPSTSGGSTAVASDKACAFFNETEVTSLFGTRPQQTSDPYGIGGTTSNCLWKAAAGGKQRLLQIGIFDGMQHYADSDKFGAENVAGLGDKAFIKKGDLGGVTIEFVRAGKTYFVLFSIAKTSGATRNDANAEADQLVALIKQNMSRL